MTVTSPTTPVYFLKTTETTVTTGRTGQRGMSRSDTTEQTKDEYREVISLLRKGYSIRDVAKLFGKGISTVQRVKSRLNL